MNAEHTHLSSRYSHEAAAAMIIIVCHLNTQLNAERKSERESTKKKFEPQLTRRCGYNSRRCLNAKTICLHRQRKPIRLNELIVRFEFQFETIMQSRCDN